MEIKSVVFKCSSQKLSQTPADNLPDFAFIGRSNVGKSSLINMLTGQNSLAKVSSTPGKTRLINHFLVDNSWYLVDLPGYGYARASKGVREGFHKVIMDYVVRSNRLFFLFVLVDSRHSPQKIDLDFIGMLGEKGVPFGIVFTKSDKLSQQQLNNSITNYQEELLKSWEELPQMFITSSEKRRGKEQILSYISEALATRMAGGE